MTNTKTFAPPAAPIGHVRCTWIDAVTVRCECGREYTRAALGQHHHAMRTMPNVSLSPAAREDLFGYTERQLEAQAIGARRTSLGEYVQQGFEGRDMAFWSEACR